MDKTLQKIADLQKEITLTEERLGQYMRAEHQEGIARSLHQLKADLKYLSILANGAPVDKDHDRKIMDFLRVHYDRLQEYSLHAAGFKS